jgi:hypothetical protein
MCTQSRDGGRVVQPLGQLEALLVGDERFVAPYGRMQNRRA